MDLLTVLAIAVGLAMDAFAVAVAAGVSLGCTLNTGHITRLAGAFGFFQFMMTVLGWLSGMLVEQFMRTFDHWIAFILLFVIGGKMILEAFRDADAPQGNCDPTRGATLLGLAVATSIDAFAVGLSLGVLNNGIWYPSIVIGLVAAGFTVVGMKLGCRLGTMVSRKVEILGGFILVGIGVKILAEHYLGRA